MKYLAMLKKRNLTYIFISALILSSYILLLNSGLPYVSLKSYSPMLNFWDLNSGMNNLWECYKNVGLDLFSYESSTFPSLSTCHNFNYGYFSLVSFGFTHLLSQNVLFWGYLQISLFTLLVVKIYMLDKHPVHVSISVLALYSPGIFILFASGNMDIQIIILLLISSFLIISKKEKIALSLICITALFKFYTAPIIVMTLFLLKKRSKTYCYILTFVTFSVICYQFFTHPLTSLGRNGAQAKFGMGILDNYLRKAGVQFSDFQGEILGATLLILSFLTIVFCYKKLTITPKPIGNLSKNQELLCINFLIMSGTSVTCYMFSLNVDYRLTFIALSGLALLQLPYTKVKYISAIFPYFWLLSLWIAFPFNAFKKYIGIDLQPIGDITMIATISYFIFQGFHIFRQVKYKNTFLHQ